MINVYSKKKVMALLLAAGLSVSTFMTSYGVTSTTAGTTTTKTVSTTAAVQQPPFSKAMLDKLVTAGTITSDQETSVLAALTNSTSAYNEVFSTLVSNGTITEAQSKSIQDAMKPSGTPPSGTGTTGGSGDSSGAPPTGNPPAGNPPSGGQPGQSSTAAPTISGTYTQSGKTATKTGTTLSSTKKDQSAVAVNNNGTLTLSKVKVTKTGNTSSEDNSNFYGLNAAVVATSGSKITIKNSTITSNSDGSNAVFSTGTNSKVTVTNVKIKTTANSSRGLDATMKGTIVADTVQIDTAGAHCAALATDRGNGTVTVNNVTATTAGEGSPGIYSTGTITATNSTFKATGSEAAVVEGKNSITLKNTSISGALKHGVMLYQSFSGDAETGTASFNMTGGTIASKVGPMFYITNTDAVINLNNVKLDYSSGVLLSASADKWGTSGSNGGIVTMNAKAQALTGDIVADSVSSVATVLTNSSTLKGTIDSKNTAKAASLSLDATSKWIVTGTSHLTALTDKDTTLSNIVDNGNTIYYDYTNTANSWLGGKTISLNGGGILTPEK